MKIGRLRGMDIDHATLQRWVVKFMPILEGKFRKRKNLVNGSWRMEEYTGLKNQDKILRILLPIIKQHFLMPLNKHSWASYSQC
jgi:transposase-like protein